MSISVYCQWCGAANNTAGRCTDMMCRGGDARPAVVEVGSDPVGDSYRTRMVKDWEPGGTIDQLRIEIAALRARVETAEKDRNDAWKHEQTLIDELHEAGGALDDAGVGRHEDDEIASGIEKLAKDRDELLDQWFKVGNLFWPHREPDDGWSADEVADEVKALRARVAALEAVERAAREYRRLMRFCMESPDSTRQDEEDRDVAEDALDAALAAVEVPRG